MSKTLISEIAPEDALVEAARIASEYAGVDADSQKMVDFQGMFSITVVVALANKSQWIVQLRNNEIDVTKAILARSKLPVGPVIPEIHRVFTNKAFFAYIQNYIAGEVWAIGDDDKDVTDAQSAHIFKALGGLLACTGINEASSSTIQSYIRPRLQWILRNEIKHEVEGLREKTTKLINRLDTLDCLPLAIIHEDVNEMNNLWAIRRLAFRNIRGSDYELPRTNDMTKAWWNGFLENMPEALKNRPEVLDGILTAAQVGLFLTSVFWPGAAPPPEDRLKSLCENFQWLEDTFNKFVRMEEK
ncbi:hypothetical protein AA313_de0203687 [Arthrobotrys entomopaga]|nr:hypothetical protein AA313_de0203687 [Arthrobotrys entomopaga]